MSLLPDSASFHERVEALFVAHRGRGVSLSPADLDLVDAWAALDVPFEVVARGLRKAAEAAMFDAPDGSGQLRSLKAARRKVEAEIAKYLNQTAGRGRAGPPSDAAAAPPPPFHHQRHTKLRAALAKLAKDHPPVAVVAGRFEALALPADFEAANRREDLALALLLRTLPFTERRSLLRQARLLVEKAQVLSTATKRESLRAHRSALVRRHWELPAFW